MKLRSKFFVSIAPVLLGILLGGLLVGFIRKNDNEMYLKIHQGIDVFGKVFKEVSFNYVDEIDPAKFLDAGVDGMLKTLDPYTTYLGEKDEEEMELITTGKYAGVGITITLRDGRVYVTAIMERYSAARERIQVGDEIVEIEGKAIAGMSLRDVQRLVRGNAGTSFKMKVDREVEGKSEKHEFILTREEIAVRNITAAEFIENGIAYIRLDRFTRTASNDLRKTINDLNAKGEVEGLIFDIRDNPGGLLDIAVDVTSKFVPESSLVVSTRGRKSEQETKFYSREQPMLTDIPLILLVNRQSASAS